MTVASFLSAYYLRHFALVVVCVSNILSLPLTRRCYEIYAREKAIALSRAYTLGSTSI